jgi:hypothetical protein
MAKNWIALYTLCSLGKLFGNDMQVKKFGNEIWGSRKYLEMKCAR